MKKFNKNNAELNIKIKQSINAYIKRIGIFLSCLLLVVIIMFFAFAKYETNSSEYTLINGIVKRGPCSLAVGDIYEFNYTGSSQEFNAPCDGEYKVELWGAQGGTSYGGLGGYSSGNIKLTTEDTLYVYVGSQGLTGSGQIGGAAGWNGGGTATNSSHSGSGHTIGGGGGGATDVRTTTGAWNDTASLRSRIIIAGGGAGAESSSSPGGAGGGLTGYNGTGRKGSTGAAGYGTGAAQNSAGSCSGSGTKTNCGGSFGYANTTNSGINPGGAGGGGYYGGGSSPTGTTGYAGGGGGGGSSFISGHNGCNAINSSGTHTSQANHFSGYYFTGTNMIDGKGYKWTTSKGSSVVGMPTHDGTTTMTGNAENGYAKITYLGEVVTLYNHGIEEVEWDVSARSINSSHTVGSFTKNESTLSATINSAQSKAAITSEKIDLSNYSKLVFEYNINDGNTKIYEYDLTEQEAYIYFVGYKSTSGSFVMCFALASTNTTYPTNIVEKVIVSQSSLFTFNLEGLYLY